MTTTAEGADAGAGEDKSRRAPPLRAELNDGFIKRLRPTRPPLGYDNKGKLAFAASDDPLSKSYILWDASRDSPPGFGVKVAGVNVVNETGKSRRFGRLQGRTQDIKKAYVRLAPGQTIDYEAKIKA